MNRIKLITLVMVLGMALVCLAACGKTEEKTEETKTDSNYKTASYDNFSIEYPKAWVAQNQEGMIHVSKDGTTDVPFMFVEKIGELANIGEYVVSCQNNFKNKYQNQMAQPPQTQTMEIGDRKLAGFTAKYSSTDGSKTITRWEFAEEINGITYHYVCEYVSSASGDEHEDETTYFEFEHMMQSMKMK